MVTQSVIHLLLLGIIFHFSYLWSIFDIYFRSPLVHGMQPVKSTLPAPAKRLFLFVADGLRADRIFESAPLADFEVAAHEKAVHRAPYLRSIMENEGSWGISHTRVPTESRPGHVAMIAGFYEDVSAVTKGWKMNPVEFDSLFNQSRHTWSFGSPDILPMFKHGATDKEKIETRMYDAEFEDFASENASKLDEWVFTKVAELFQSAKTNHTLDAMLRQDKVVFFLHLLGLDTNGHAHRPHSSEYIQNIYYVDLNLQRVVQLVEEFYDDDGKSAYVFSADHGMSDIGNHGDGNPDNTRTPLIVWGAGVSKPEKVRAGENASGHDAVSRDWDCTHLKRMDVMQADIAPLMASLIGVNFPMNSVGILPLDYLDNSREYKADVAFTNAKQILNQYLVKAEMKQKTEPFFQPFSKLQHAGYLDRISTLIAENENEKAEKLCTELIELCLEGLRYFQTYDWLFLRTIVSSGYLGWIFYSTTFIIETYVLKLKAEPRNRSLFSFALTAGLAGAGGLLRYKSAPWMYYVYALFPVYFWTSNIQKRRSVSMFFGDLMRKVAWWRPFLQAALYILGLEILVLSYFYREVLSIWLVVMGVVWPLLFKETFRRSNWQLLCGWCGVCLAAAVFMIIPLNQSESPSQFISGGFVLVLLALGFAVAGDKVAFMNGSEISPTVKVTSVRWIILVQALFNASMLAVVTSSSFLLREKKGLPLFNQYAAWLLLLGSLIFAFWAISGSGKCQYYVHRLVVIFLGFAPSMICLSVNYEVTFYTAFGALLYAWVELERRLYTFECIEFGAHDDQQPSGMDSDTLNEATTYRSLTSNDVRISLLFLFFINLAFFGTGNFASLASFQISSVYRLITIFDPFLMGALLSFKILIPFFILSSTLSILSKIILHLPPFSIFLVAVAWTDVITLNFFFMVRDDGSWLEIGTSISHFVIACLFEVLSVALFLISWGLVKGVQSVPFPSLTGAKKNK